MKKYLVDDKIKLSNVLFRLNFSYVGQKHFIVIINSLNFLVVNFSIT